MRDITSASVKDFMDLDLMVENYPDGMVRLWRDYRRLYALNVMLYSPETAVFRDNNGNPLVIFGIGPDMDLFTYISRDFCKKFRPILARRFKQVLCELIGDSTEYKIYAKSDSKVTRKFAEWLGYEATGEIPCFHNGTDRLMVFKHVRFAR